MDGCRGVLELGLGLFEPPQQDVGVFDEAKSGVGETESAPDLLRELDTGFALKLGQLLADGARRLREGVGDGRDIVPRACNSRSSRSLRSSSIVKRSLRTSVSHKRWT